MSDKTIEQTNVENHDSTQNTQASNDQSHLNNHSSTTISDTSIQTSQIFSDKDTEHKNEEIKKIEHSQNDEKQDTSDLNRKQDDHKDSITLQNVKVYRL